MKIYVVVANCIIADEDIFGNEHMVKFEAPVGHFDTNEKANNFLASDPCRAFHFLEVRKNYIKACDVIKSKPTNFLGGPTDRIEFNTTVREAFKQAAIDTGYDPSLHPEWFTYWDYTMSIKEIEVL